MKLLDGDIVAADVVRPTGITEYEVKYVRGSQLIFIENIRSKDPKNYAFNAHGDVVQLVDTGGSIAEDYEYEAFGHQTTTADEQDMNPFRYCGEYNDQESGDIYLRARYYSPTWGRFFSEDPYWNVGFNYSSNMYENQWFNSGFGADIAVIRQNANIVNYCLNNPICYIDPSGNKPYTVKVGKDKYDLFVSSLYIDSGDTLTSIAAGAVDPLLAPLSWAGKRLSGFKEINGGTSFYASTVNAIASKMSESKLFKYAGHTFDAVDILSIANDIFRTKDYQVNEAIYNHMSGMFMANTRKLVERKFNNVKERVSDYMNSGIIGVKKGSEMFRPSAFKYEYGWAYEYDPLFGKERHFSKDSYYFVLYDKNHEGLFKDINFWV